jgi:hypothetical protein
MSSNQIEPIAYILETWVSTKPFPYGKKRCFASYDDAIAYARKMSKKLGVQMHIIGISFKGTMSCQ